MARVGHTCNDVYQVEKTSLSSSQQKRYEESPSSKHKATGLTIESGKRDCVTGTALKQG